MHRPARPARFAAGFTLVELLVVIAIIGMLMALVMPAVNGAREAGRRTSCANNLTQQTLGLIRFNDSKRYIPGWRNAVPYTGGTNFYSWPVMILPNLERKDVYNSVASAGSGSPGVYLSSFVCPSSPPDGLTTPVLAYAGSAAVAATPDAQRASGVMIDTTGNVKVSMDQVSDNDGGATTLILSEKCISGTTNPPLYQAIWDVRPAFNATGSVSFANGVTNWVAGTTYTAPVPAFGVVGTGVVNKVINASTLTSPGQLSQPSSNHPGGVNAAFCGGNVEFLKDSLSPRVYAQLMSWSHVVANGGSPYNSANWAGAYPILLETDYK